MTATTVPKTAGEISDASASSSRWPATATRATVNDRRGERSVSRIRRKFLVSTTIVMGMSMAGALLAAGSASAASRGFTVKNDSSHTLVLEAVKPVPKYVCDLSFRCVPGGNYSMDFEGRPAEGSVLHPGQSQRFELKYGFSLEGGVQYAALLGYKIGTTGNTVEYRIEVYSTSNESSCTVTPANAGRCTAEGRNLTFHNS